MIQLLNITIIVKKFISFLNGNDSSILEDMKYKMEKAAESLDFETAARYRDYINSINSLVSREKTLKFAGSSNNIVIAEPLAKDYIKIFLISKNRIIFSKKYILENRDMKKLRKVIRNHILVYFDSKTSASPVIIKKDEVDEAQIIYRYLNSKPDNYILIPPDWLQKDGSCHIDEAIERLLCQ